MTEEKVANLLHGQRQSREFACRLPRRPGPLEIIAAQPAGHIHAFADEIEVGQGFRRHAARIEARRINTAKRDLRRAIAFGAGGLDLPVLHLIR